MLILIVANKLSVGNALYLEHLTNRLEKLNQKYFVTGDIDDSTHAERSTHGGGSFTMILDTLNPLTYIRFLKLVFRKKKEIQSVFFIAAHAANIFSILLLRICTPRIHRITHIHDVTAHSGSNNKTIIFLSNYLTAKFSTKVICYGEFLKNKIHELYKINPDLYLALGWANHYKILIVDKDNLKVLAEKRILADKVLLFANNADLVDNLKEINEAKSIERGKKINLGKLTPEQAWMFSEKYFDLIDKLCDKLFLNNK